MVAILEGIRVLDWTIFMQGPAATALLGDLGAEVIKIEERGVGDPARGVKKSLGAIVTSQVLGGRNAFFENCNRNKKSIAIDLTKPQGKEIIYHLAERSDVFVQNFRKGVAERMGLDYKTLKKYNPHLIYASASGWGPEGPDAYEPSADYVCIARAGIMSLAGEPNMPPQMVQAGLGDQTGAIMTAFGIVSALLARERSGVAQEINASILGGLTHLLSVPVALNLLTGATSFRAYRAKAVDPMSNHYRCQDDKWIALSDLNPVKFWPNLCKAMSLEHLQNDPRFANLEVREKNREECIRILDEVFARKPRQEWIKLLKENGVIYSAVNSVADLRDDPQVIANKYIVEFDHPTGGKVKVVGHPIIFDQTPMKIQREAPEFGQHTEEVLLEVGGYSWKEIEELREKEVI